MNFLQDHIMTKFGVPISIVLDNATYFSSIRLTTFAQEKGIKLHYSANYYPQGNGLAESSNKNLIKKDCQRKLEKLAFSITKCSLD